MPGNVDLEIGLTRWDADNYRVELRFSWPIVTGSDDNTARVWDAQTGAQIALLRGHAYHVVSARYSPDGKRFVTAGDDGNIGIIFVEMDDLMYLAQLHVTRSLNCQERLAYLRETLD